MFKAEIIRRLSDASKWQKLLSGDYSFQLNGEVCSNVYEPWEFLRAVADAVTSLYGNRGSNRCIVRTGLKPHDVIVEITEENFHMLDIRFYRRQSEIVEEEHKHAKMRRSFLDLIVESVHQQHWQQNADNSWSTVVYEYPDFLCGRYTSIANHINEAFRVLSLPTKLIEPNFMEDDPNREGLRVTITSKLALEAVVGTYILYDVCNTSDVIFSLAEVREVIRNAKSIYANLNSATDYEALLAAPYSEEIPRTKTLRDVAYDNGQVELGDQISRALNETIGAEAFIKRFSPLQLTYPS